MRNQITNKITGNFAVSLVFIQVFIYFYYFGRMHPVDQVGQPVRMKQTVDQKRNQPVTIGTILHHNKRTNQQQNQRRRKVPYPTDLSFAEWSKVIKLVKTKRKVREGKWQCN